MNRIDDANYKNYFKFNLRLNTSGSKLSSNQNSSISKTLNPNLRTPIGSSNRDKRLAYQILNPKSSNRSSYQNRKESIQANQRILNVEPFRNKNIFNGNKRPFSKVKHASVDFSWADKTKQNPLFTKRNLRNFEKIKKYHVSKDEFRKFKIAGNFPKSKKKRTSRDNDLKYFGVKKASKINLISDKSKMSDRRKSNQRKRSVLKTTKPRFSHSPQRTKKHNFAYFAKQPVLINQRSFANNPTTRILVQTSRDSFGSAATNVFSSNSPKSAGNKTNAVNPVMMSQNPTQQLITESMQDHYHHPKVYQSNQNIGTPKIMLTNSIRSVSQSHNNFSIRNHIKLDVVPNRHRRMHSFQQNPKMFKRSDSIQSSRSCQRSVKSKSLRKFVKSFRNNGLKMHQRPKKYFKERRVSNITRTGKFGGENSEQGSLLNHTQQPVKSCRSFSNQSASSVNKIFTRIKNLTERIANKNLLGRKDSRGSQQRHYMSNQTIFRTQTNPEINHRKYQKKQRYRNKPKNAKNEYFTTPLKGKRKMKKNKKEKISNYRNKFMKGWQELRSKGKSLAESEIDDRKIVKAIQANSGRKRLFKEKDGYGDSKMFHGVWDQIDNLLFVMELNSQVGLGKS